MASFLDFLGQPGLAPWYTLWIGLLQMAEGRVSTLENQVATQGPNSLICTSTTPLTIGAGPQTLIVPWGRQFQVDAWFMIATGGNVMVGRITDYSQIDDSLTAHLTVEVGYVLGAGTYDAWNCSITCPPPPGAAVMIGATPTAAGSGGLAPTPAAGSQDKPLLGSGAYAYSQAELQARRIALAALCC
jgi:hypothetical protein